MGRILNTLTQLRSGELIGTTHLKLSENLTEFPKEILSLSDTLEVLDLSNNQLTQLPPKFAQLTKLKIFFASNNPFETLPEVLGQCQNLEIVGLKTNKIKTVPANSLPKKLRWLILTDNAIEQLPETLGERSQLQKLALAGNRLIALPHSFSKLKNLELLRISANKLTEFPSQLLDLPKLAWLAFAGNPFNQTTLSTDAIPQISADKFELKNILGQGASGIIYEANWKTSSDKLPHDIAVKVFKGSVTSDGYPEDELQACLQVGSHPNLVKPIAWVNDPTHLALVMSLIPNSYRNLGLPPSLETCTRDTFLNEFRLSIQQIDRLVNQMSSVITHLNQQKVCHGDLYAHNTLIDDNDTLIFGDFGASTCYQMQPKAIQQQIQKIEYRAFLFFIEDLLSVCEESDKQTDLYNSLKELTKLIH